MIPREVVLDFAEQAGFGGQSRATLLPRLIKFAELLTSWQRTNDALLCYGVGNRFSAKGELFSDGQMDGAFQCAETLEGKREKNT